MGSKKGQNLKKTKISAKDGGTVNVIGSVETPNPPPKKKSAFKTILQVVGVIAAVLGTYFAYLQLKPKSIKPAISIEHFYLLFEPGVPLILHYYIYNLRDNPVEVTKTVMGV